MYTSAFTNSTCSHSACIRNGKHVQSTESAATSKSHDARGQAELGKSPCMTTAKSRKNSSQRFSSTVRPRAPWVMQPHFAEQIFELLSFCHDQLCNQFCLCYVHLCFRILHDPKRRDTCGSICICATGALVAFAIVAPSRQLLLAVVPKIDGWGAPSWSQILPIEQLLRWLRRPSEKGLLFFPAELLRPLLLKMLLHVGEDVHQR